MESINVVVHDDSSSPKEEMPKEEVVQTIEVNNDQEEVSTPIQRHLLEKTLVLVEKNHPLENIVGNMNEGLRLRNRVVNHITYSCHLSMLKPKKVEEALEDESWVEAMHEEFNQFSRNEVWTLVPRPLDHNVIGTK
jgi:hypothetical protein